MQKIKITTIKENGEVDKFLFKFKDYTHIEWNKKLFYTYAKTKWPEFEWVLNDEYNLTKAELKENKEKYLDLVRGFLSDIKIDKSNYYFDNIKVTKDTEFSWDNYNKDDFYIDKGDTIGIEANLKDVNLESQYYFEKEFCDANFYLNNHYLWKLDKPNPYLKDEKFVKEIEKVTNEVIDKFKRISNKTLKTELTVKPLLESINSLLNKEIKNELLKKVETTDLTFNEYEKIEDFVEIIKQINKLKNSDYFEFTILHRFNNYLDKNEYLKKSFLNSVSKEELFKLLIHEKNNETFKEGILEKEIICRFYENNYKEITQLFLENNIHSKTKKLEQKGIER